MKRKVHVAIGWGHLRDINKATFGSGSIRQRLKSNSFLYSALPKLETLEQKYPDRFKLKLLGTHEKFIVCDRSNRMIGEVFVSANASNPDEEKFLNEAMVMAGFAYNYSPYSSGCLNREGIIQAEQIAHSERRRV